MKDKLTELFSELNKDELEQASLMKINYFSEISKLISIIFSKKYSALLKTEKLLQPEVNTAAKALEQE